MHTETDTDPADVDEVTEPKLGLQQRIPRYVAEMVIGFVLAALIVLALIATVNTVPFIYQGF
jgi:hypothetical protein